MADQFYNRIARVLIGKYATTKAFSVGLEIKSPLRITFELTKTEFSIMNEGTITINNLSQQSRDIIRDGLFCILEAGYVDAGGPQMIFHGEIVNVSHNVKKPEIITTITVQDGHTAIKKSNIALSYKKGTPISQIINDAVKALKLPKNSTFSHVNIPTTQLRGGFGYAGNAASLLDLICGDNGLTWSVQNGSVKIYNNGKTDNLPALSSVLIGSPRRLFRNQQSVSLENFSGYEFDALLMPKVEPGSMVTIRSLDIPKPISLQVAEVKHSGDNYGDKWQTTVKARDL